MNKCAICDQIKTGKVMFVDFSKTFTIGTCKDCFWVINTYLILKREVTNEEKRQKKR